MAVTNPRKSFCGVSAVGGMSASVVPFGALLRIARSLRVQQRSGLSVFAVAQSLRLLPRGMVGSVQLDRARQPESAAAYAGTARPLATAACAKAVFHARWRRPPCLSSHVACALPPVFALSDRRAAALCLCPPGSPSQTCAVAARRKIGPQHLPLSRSHLEFFTPCPRSPSRSTRTG